MTELEEFYQEWSKDKKDVMPFEELVEWQIKNLKQNPQFAFWKLNKAFKPFQKAMNERCVKFLLLFVKKEK